MKNWHLSLATLLSLVLTPSVPAETTLSGYIEGELRYYPSKPLFKEQSSFFSSIAIEPEINWSSADNNQFFRFKPFARLDSSKGHRSHADIREFFYIYAGNGWQIEAGIDKVYWGVTESAHLVDIINQTDVIEAFGGEEKLGQPLISFSLENTWGNLDLYVLPYFREQQLSDKDERYRIGLVGLDKPLPIDYSKVLFESSQKQHHIDVAARWSQSFNDLDIALSAFHGTDREAIPIVASISSFETIPDISDISAMTLYYQQLTQIGLELQYLLDDWAFKFEGTLKYESTGNHGAYATGFEYTFSDMEPFGQDIGILVEYLWNNRKSVDISAQSFKAIGITPPDNISMPKINGHYLSPFENDLFIGTRFGLNNISSTEFLAGIIHDLETNAFLSTFEGSTRVGDNIKISLNLYLLTNIDRDSSFWFYRKDDLIELKTAWYF